MSVIASSADDSTEKDDILQKLTQTTFDPIQFLNESLPSLSISSQAAINKQGRINQLQSSSSETQALLSILSTHNIRSSTDLTTLTDEILRSGNRLAYEVEVLRGDANNLYELLTDTLRDDIQGFIQDESFRNGSVIENATIGIGEEQGPSIPAFIQQLRTLGLVKSRLEAVINVFGQALKWPIPPSDVSVASSLISVSAPELGVVNSAEDDKAREVARKFRAEITDLLDTDGGGYAGLEAATKRVNEFKSLATVWKGTMEEKARNRIADGMIRLIDERKRLLETRNTAYRSIPDTTRSSSVPGRVGTPSNPAGGIFGGLRKLRDEIYLE